MKTPKAQNETPAEPRVLAITISPEGRILFHHLTTELLPVAEALDPANAELAQRRQAAKRLQRHTHGSPSDS